MKRNIALTLFFCLMSPTFISFASDANSDNRDMSQVPSEEQQEAEDELYLMRRYSG
jgi:hypothetical protein